MVASHLKVMGEGTTCVTSSGCASEARYISPASVAFMACATSAHALLQSPSADAAHAFACISWMERNAAGFQAQAASTACACPV